MSLRNRIAVVTGGSRGIGRAVCLRLGAMGALVVVNYVSRPAAAEETADQIRAAGGQAEICAFDVADAAATEAAFKKILEDHGRIDILVNNAGTNIRKRPEDLSYEEWRFVLNTNLDSAFRCSTACHPAMKRNGGGKILNNGSMMSLFASPWSPAYAASKGGMVQLTKALATAWAEDNIQVNCFLPGWIDTPLTLQTRQQIEGLNEKVLVRTPAKRWGTLDDFRGIAVFLASPASDFITGAAIPVDGGFSSSCL